MNESRLALSAESMVRAWNARDVDAVLAAFSPDARLRDGRGPAVALGHAGIRAALASTATGFPGVELEIRRTLVAGGVVSVELSERGLATPARCGVLIADFDSAGRIVALARYS